MPKAAMCIRMKILPLLCALTLAAPLAAQRPERPTLAISGYVIDAEIDTATHRIAAKAVVSFTAPETAELVSFGFHPALKVTKISDEAGKVLTGERSADGTIRVTPTAPFVKGQVYRWTFEYEGAITGSEDGPVEGLKLAAIQEPITYLLYAARWFPMTGYMTNRFTAQMHIRVPQAMHVFASGAQGASKPVTLASGKPGEQFDFNWDKPGFPGTVIAGRFVGPVSAGPATSKSGSLSPTRSRPTISPRQLPKSTTSLPAASAHPRLPTSTSLNFPTTPCPPSGLRNWPLSSARASVTRAAFACLPTPSPTSGGAPRSAPAPSTTPGSPTAWPATAS